jgi:hypothetical protein
MHRKCCFNEECINFRPDRQDGKFGLTKKNAPAQTPTAAFKNTDKNRTASQFGFEPD